MPAQQSGTIDRIFNSTIAWPQQLIWRILRATKEDDVDLWSEKGLLDFANVPILGLWDDHKEDVMPDYMAETMFGKEKGSTGWKSQIGAAILSDPLTYLTGGLSTVGKGVKGMTRATQIPALNRTLEALSRTGRGALGGAKGKTFTSADDYLAGLTVKEFDSVLEQATSNVISHPERYTNSGQQLKGLRKSREAISGLGAEHLKSGVMDLMKHEGHRKLAIGIPGLASLGARIHIPGEQQSWWKVFTGAVRGGTDKMPTAWVTRHLAGIPFVGKYLDTLTEAPRQLAGGWQVGAEARSAVKEAGKRYKKKDFNKLTHWLDSDKGGGQVIHKIRKRGKAQILKEFDAAIAQGKSPEEALTLAMRKIGNEGDTTQQLWARLNGVKVDDAAAVAFPKTPQTMRKRLDKQLEAALKDGDQARALALSGDYDATLTWLEVGDAAKTLLSRRASLEFGRTLADTAFDIGKGARKMTSMVFRTGTSTQHAQKALHKFLSESARGHDQVAQLSKMLYTGFKQLLKDPDMKGWTHEDIDSILGGLMESSALHIELVESLKLGKVNSSNALEVATGWEDFTKRHHQIMKTFETVLDSKGVKGELRDRIAAKMQSEVFDYLPVLDEQGISQHLTRELKLRDVPKKVWTPQQKKRMRRRYNAHVLRGGKQEGLYVGELGETELRSALDSLESVAQRDLTPQEIAAHIDDNPMLSGFREKHGLTHEEFISVFNRHGKGKTRRVVRLESPKQFPLWNLARKSWTVNAAQESTDAFGLTIKVTDNATYQVKPTAVTEGTAKRSWGIDTTKEYKTLEEAMRDTHGFLDSESGLKWRRRYGPDLEGLSEAELKKLSTRTEIQVPTGELADLRKAALDELNTHIGAEDILIMRGKGRRFDERKLPGYGEGVRVKGGVLVDGDAMDWYRLREAERARAHSLREGLTEPNMYGKEGDALFEAPNIPTIEHTKVLDAPRGPDEMGDLFTKILEKKKFLFDGKEGPKEFSDWARAYTEARFALNEFTRWMRLSKSADIAADVPYEILDEVSRSLAVMGNEIERMVLKQLPEKAQRLFAGTRHITTNIFEAARATGQYAPGSPIAYVGRFFNKASTARIQAVLGDIAQDSLGASIIMRITAASPGRFARHADSMSIGQLNVLHEELRTMSLTNPNLQGWYDEVEDIMRVEGLSVTGAKGRRLKWTGKRLEEDPILNTLSRLANANQDASLEKYFDGFLAASTDEAGNILAMGGKVIAVLDDAETPIRTIYPDTEVVKRLKAKGVKVRDPKGKYTGSVAVEAKTLGEVEKSLDLGTASWVLIEAEDGRVIKIPAAMDKENGYGLLRLGKPLDDLGLGMDDVPVKPTVAQSFVRAATRSDLDSAYHLPSEMAQVPLGGANNIYDLVGEHVVYGAKNIVLGAVKTASQTLKVTPTAMRNFDSINYMIKSFQTVFRVPFHVANLASGVFQAHLAGASVKSLIAGYTDTMRFMWGNTDFIKHSDSMLSLLDVEGFTSRGVHFLPRLDLMQAVRRNGGSVMTKVKDRELREWGLDRVDDLVLDLGDGRELAMADFIRVAGDMQLYGTFASSLTRGSRTTADSLIKLKLNTLDPDVVGGTLGKAIKGLGGRPGEIREITESVNRTATAMALIRDGHTLERAIEITKNAHVPYERLTPIEKDYFKRAFLYYSFPRHYMPWAATRFAEDPSKLAALTNTIKQKKLFSTDEGRAHLKLGDYRLDVGRLNANMEAAMMIGAFADNLAMPLGRAVGAGPSHMYPYDPNVLTNQITDAGLLSFGGVFSLMGGGGRLLPQGERAGMHKPDTWNDARTAIWPIKLALTGARLFKGDMALPSKEEQSPYVQYTTMERIIADSDLGLGVRKVRPDAEVVHAYYQYRSLVRKLELKAAATDDPGRRKKYIDNARMLGETLKAMAANHKDQAFD